MEGKVECRLCIWLGGGWNTVIGAWCCERAGLKGHAADEKRLAQSRTKVLLSGGRGDKLGMN